MRCIPLVLLFLLSSCLGNYLPEVSIPTADASRVATMTVLVIENADMNQDGKVEGRDESTAFWNGLLVTFSTFAPAPAEPEPK